LGINSPSALLRIAEDRIEESEALHRAGLHEGSVYIAGYGLELMLEAKVSQRLDLPNLFEENFAQSLGRQV